MREREDSETEDATLSGAALADLTDAFGQITTMLRVASATEVPLGVHADADPSHEMCSDALCAMFSRAVLAPPVPGLSLPSECSAGLRSLAID